VHVRLFSGPKRDKRPVGPNPPPWLLPFGAGGLAISLIGRSIGGPIGEGCANLGCVATAFGAFAFSGLLFAWLYPRKRQP
jgi:hypothetical protein